MPNDHIRPLKTLCPCQCSACNGNARITRHAVWKCLSLQSVGVGHYRTEEEKGKKEEEKSRIFLPTCAFSSPFVTGLGRPSEHRTTGHQPDGHRHPPALLHLPGLPETDTLCPRRLQRLRHRQLRGNCHGQTILLYVHRSEDAYYGRGQGGKGTKEWRLDRGYRPKKTGETVDRRQNDGSIKAVSPRHCPATCALRNCCFNCRTWAESQRQCPLHCCWRTTRSERNPTFAAQLHLPAHDLFWAEGPAGSNSLLLISSGLRVQQAPPPCSWSHLEPSNDTQWVCVWV